MQVNDLDGVLHRLQAGDPAAFEELYDRFSRLVFGIALRMLNDADAAEDIVQTVYLKLWSAPSCFRGGNFSAWIARVARNQALDALRNRARHESDAIPVDVPTDEPLDETVLANIDRSRRRAALDGIPAEQRIPIELGFFGGITHEEIAKKIRTPLGTVKTRIRAGLLKLRRALSDEVAV